MVYINTLVRVIDNTGVSLVKCIRIFGKSSFSRGTVGDVVVVVIKRCLKNNSLSIKYNDIMKGVIVRSSTALSRIGPLRVSSDNSAIILVNERLLPLGSRIYGFVFLELAKKAIFSRILVIATAVI